MGTVRNADRLRRFINAYRETMNGTQAALAAGISATYAAVEGSKLLRHPWVQEELARLAFEDEKRSDVRSADILRALMEIAYFDPGELFEKLVVTGKNGQSRFLILHRDIIDLPRHVRRTIKGFKIIRTNLVTGDGQSDTLMEVQFWDKNKALALLAQHKGLLGAKVSDDDLTDAQLEEMDDETFLATHRANVAKLEEHIKAKRELSKKIAKTPEAELVAVRKRKR